MGYSKSESTQLHAKFRERFGELPEGLHRCAANRGQADRMYEAMETALETGNPPNWDDYVTPYLKRSKQAESADA